MSPGVTSHGLPQDGHARPTNSTVQLDCQCSHSQNDHTFLVRVVHPIADGKDVATCGRPIDWPVFGFIVPRLHDDITDLLLLLMLQHRRKAPLPCHVIYMCTI